MFSAIGVVKVNFLNNIVMYAIMTVGFSMFAGISFISAYKFNQKDFAI